MVKTFEPIYRTFTLSRISDKSSGQFLRALAESGVVLLLVSVQALNFPITDTPLCFLCLSFYFNKI
jgi:hypothetical protein